MKTQTTFAILAIIGSIVAVTGISDQEAHADSSDKMLFKMMEVNEKLVKLQGNEELTTIGLAKSSFEIKQIKKGLLEINEMNDGNDERLNEIYAYLKENYQNTFEEYEKDVKQYSKENGLTISEKKLVAEIIKNKLTFENQEAKENLQKEKINRIITEVKKTDAKEKYQKLVNQIGVKLANDANGGIVEKVHHKAAIKEIISSKQLELAVPAIDRIIPQINNENVKEKLHTLKDNIKLIQEKKSKQTENEVFELNSDPQVKVEFPIKFNENQIVFGGVLEQVLEDELIESLNEIQQVYEEYEVQTIESILDEDVVSSLEEVIQVTEEDEEELEEKKEKQRKESRENKSNNSKSSLGSGNSDNRNENANSNKGNSEGKGNGKGNGK